MTEEPPEMGADGFVRNIGPHIAGILESRITDADSLPRLEANPDGFVSFSGSQWNGGSEEFSIIDARIVMGAIDLKFLMTIELAISLKRALEAAIQDADVDGVEE